jgi:uncharacterized HAD superfamily protein
LGLKIGLDIDGVVADSFPIFLEELNKHYGKNVTEINNYDMTKLYDVAWEDLDAFFEQNIEYLFFEPRPMEGALENINAWLKAGHEIIYVTARRPGAEERVTLRWFERHGITSDSIIFTGGVSKTFAVKDFGLDVFVEDFMSNALEIAAIGVPVLLLDAPYNQGKLPEGVTRCCNWEEIKSEIEQLAQRNIKKIVNN